MMSLFRDHVVMKNYNSMSKRVLLVKVGKQSRWLIPSWLILQALKILLKDFLPDIWTRRTHGVTVTFETLRQTFWFVEFKVRTLELKKARNIYLLTFTYFKILSYIFDNYWNYYFHWLKGNTTWLLYVSNLG